MADNNSPLYINPVLSAVAIKFRQKGFIADTVMPRMQVDKMEFIHLKDRMKDWISPTSSLVGRASKPHNISPAFQDATTMSTQNQGLDEGVPNQDQMNGPNESAMARATQHIMGKIEIGREIRVATIFDTAAYFDGGETLTTTGQFSHASSDPVAQILAELDACFLRPNILVMSQEVWAKVRAHAKVLMAIYGALKTNGLATREQFAALLEVDQLIIGGGWYNSAAKGQTPNQTRIWPKICAGIHLGQSGGPDSGNTWGYTAQFGPRVAGTIVDPDIGMFGGVRVRAGESVIEVPAETSFGFLFKDAIA
jgi:hypothetical protein